MPATARPPQEMPDEDLLDLVQRQTFRFFWDLSHPLSGLAKDRASDQSDRVAVGGSGFGVMAILVAAERGWITRDQALSRLTQIASHLERAKSYHGVFPHFMDGATGETIPFAPGDDGGDLVETSFLFQGLLCARQYFATGSEAETGLRNRINALWQRVEWNWHTRSDAVLTWHWSPKSGWALNHHIRGWNECLIAYVLAASSPTHKIEPNIYHQGWASGEDFANGKSYYGIELPLGPAYGGPLFFAHYSFLGIDPRGLKDRYADYWRQNVNHTRINHAHALNNPMKCLGYSNVCWGLTASDNATGYSAHAPTNDRCVIAPTAALASIPYCPELSMPALRHFLGTLGDRIWRAYGFTDAFSEQISWYSSDHLAIDQGPIIVMIENYRTGLLWRLFMSCPEVKAGLAVLGFESPHLA
ncbi:MAG: glucoamylase family protein [Alphaproteobacteria bacterium]